MAAEFGVLIPTREAIMSGRADPSTLYQIAELAESLGFHSVWVGDSLTARPRIDALTTLAAVGARTQRVRLGTAIFLAALRNPILLAYQLASLDWLTSGRAVSESPIHTASKPAASARSAMASSGAVCGRPDMIASRVGMRTPNSAAISVRAFLDGRALDGEQALDVDHLQHLVLHR